MKKFFHLGAVLGIFPLLLTGCGTGQKGVSPTAIYGVMAVLALLLLAGYCLTVPKRDPWFLLLFASVFVINSGYLVLAISQNLAQALWANRLSYLGSVFLPLSMWMIIADVCRIRHTGRLSAVLFSVGIVVFLVAASPGYLTVYYREVSFTKASGVAELIKVYGPLHGLYLFYLVGYFLAMLATIIFATVRKRIESTAYAAILAVAVFVNIVVWAIEQLVDFRFEFLSVSYIITECFLLALHFLIAETRQAQTAVQTSAVPEMPDPDAAETEQLALFREGLTQLTPKEREICNCYLSGMSTADVMESLNIKENTLKFHNKNIYSKLGVNSRKQLLALHKKIT